ncbi:uncharacterized protein LOC130366846 [Hyla sarda]|uniref:uncharacterized protein LOC130366846 n=1 Tax=Hyla sarda TaxID=327740 RepID=UPI0024C3E81D|nr:uncharacterized protein LOC130366846 [Hyla sarda]
MHIQHKGSVQTDEDILILAHPRQLDEVYSYSLKQGELKELLRGALDKNIITKGTYEYLTVTYPKMMCLYLLPKVHKDTKNPPGQPIVSGNESLCESLKKDLLEFMEALNNNIKNIRLSVKYSQQEVDFLDLKIYKDKNGQATDLSRRFEERVYSKRMIKQGHDRAMNTRREDVLKPKDPKQEDSQQADPTLKKWIPETSSITYKRAKNLRDILMHSYHEGVSVWKLEEKIGPIGSSMDYENRLHPSERLEQSSKFCPFPGYPSQNQRRGKLNKLLM